MVKADFSKIIKDSIKITKSNKRLWVFGLVLASLGAGANIGSGGNFGDALKQNQKQENSVVDYKIPTDQSDPNLLNSNLLTLDLPEVLGSMNNRAESATSSLKGLLNTVPFSFYVALGLLTIATVTIFIAVSLYGKSWAQSGLIYGVYKESVGESLTLSQMSDKGKLNAVEVIKVRVLPGLALALIVIVSILILLIPVVLLGETGKVIAVFIGILWAVAVVTASIILGASVNLGILAINLESLKWKEGFGRGFTVFKKFFMDVFIMLIINCFSGCVFGVASMVGLLVFGGIGIASVMGAVAFPPFMIAAGPIVFLALLVIIMLMGFIGAISAVFTQSTWVLLYRQLMEENNEQQ